MWELDQKEGRAPNNWCFQTLVLQKTLESKRTSRRLNQSILKDNNPKYSLEWLMLTLKLQSFGHLMQRAGSLENTLLLGKFEGMRTRGKKRVKWMDGIINSMNKSLSKLRKRVKDKEAWGAGVAKIWIRLGEWTTKSSWVNVSPKKI